MAFAEGNALGKGPQILRLGSEDVDWIRRRAAAGDPVFMQLEVRARGCDQVVENLSEVTRRHRCK